MPQDADKLEPDRLRYQVEDLQRKLESSGRELLAKDEAVRRVEQRFRDLNAQIRDLEEQAGSFHREAAAGASELDQTEETLKVCDLARGQLSAALERQNLELERWREQARLSKARTDELEMSLRRREDALAELQRRYQEACRLLAIPRDAGP